MIPVPDPELVGKVPLTRGQVAIVDSADYETVMSQGSWFARWSPCTQSFYAYRSLPRRDGRRQDLALHAFLTGFAMTDHANGDTLDNRRINLRLATWAQNNANSDRKPNTVSGHRGITWFKRNSRWHVRIGKGPQFIGSFLDLDEAIVKYHEAARERWGDFVPRCCKEKGRKGNDPESKQES